MSDIENLPTPASEPPRPSITLNEDWLSTLIGLGLVLIVGAGIIEFGSLIPWPIFGLFAE